MGKKDVLRSFNPDDFEVTEPSTVTAFDPNEFEVVSAPKVEVDALTTFQEGQEKDAKFNQIISEIPDMDDSRKNSLKDLVKRGVIKGDQITDVILTYQGKHPKQSGGDSSKFYTDEKGIPHPLANNERPPKDYQINSIWGDQTDADDDTPLTTLGKNIYNILPSIAENAVDLVHMPYGAIAGEEADWYKSLKNSANYLKAKTSTASNAPVINTEGIDEFSDVFEPSRWNFTADNVAGTVGQIVKSVGEFGLGGGFVSKAAGATTKLGKGASLFTASYATQLGETIDRAKEAGLTTEDAYRVGSAINVPIAMVDLALGVEGRMFKDEIAKTGRKELVDNLVAGFIKDSEGKITKEGLDELFKSTLIANSALVKNWGKQTMGDIVGEGSQEAIQAFVQNAGEQLYDKMSDEEKAKFGTDAFSPKAFADYLQNFVVGAIGGAPSGVAVNRIKQITKDDEQSKTAFGLIQQREGEDIEATNTRINSYKENIENEVRQGKLTREQADNAITRINAYKDYNDMLGSLPVDETEKRQLFDLSFQKQSLETEISQVKDPKKLNPIEQGQYASKEKLANDIQKNINEIIFNAQAKEETNLPSKTVEDIIKKENPVKKEGEKKPKVPEHIQAILDRNKKETSKKEYPEETRSYEQIPNLEFNNPTKVSGGFRTIHKKAVEFLEKQPGKQILGKIVHKPFEYGGKKNKTFGVEMPDGKILRFSSSMQRDEGFRGHMRTEHLVKEDELEGFPIGLKVEEIPSFEEGKPPKKVIKAFNANTGKFVGYMKETNTGKKIEYNKEQIDYLEHLGTVVEPPIIPPSEEEGGETVTPVKPIPTQPKGGTDVQIPTKDEYVESEIEALKSSEDNDYHPSLDNVYREALSKQYDAIHGNKEPVKVKVGSVSDLLNSVALYNRLNRGEKKSEQGVKMLRRIQDDANELGHSLRFIKKGKIQLLNEKGKQVYNEAKVRSKDVIEAEKAEKAKLKKALNRTPQSIEHQVAMDIANGVRFNLDEFVRITGVQPKELNRLLFDKKGQSLEFYGTRLEEHGGVIPAGMDDVDIANEVAGIIESNYSGNNAIENAKKYALETYEKEMNGGMTDAEVARMAESIGEKATQVIINTATNQTEEELIENNNKLKTAEDDKAENKTAEEIVSNITGITEGTDNPFSEDFNEEESYGTKDIITGTYEEGEEPFQKSQELIYAENEFKKAEKELKAAKTAFDSKRKELGKEINNDQEDLFGERKSTEGAGLFDERVDMSAYEDVITPFKQRYDKAVQEFNKAKKKLDDLQNSEDSQMSLFQQETVKAKKKEVDKIINHFKKVLSKDIKIVYDPKLKASGKWSPKTKTITINPKFAGKDTPIHEVGHILIDAMGGTDNRVIKAAIKQLEGTPLWEETARRYPLRKESIKIVNGNKVVIPAYTIDDLGKEVLAEAIGREGAGIFDSVSEQNKFKTYLNYIFDWLKRYLGLEKNIAKNLAKQVISGINVKPISGKSSKQEGEYIELINGFYSPIEKQLRDFKLANQSATKWLNMFGKGDEVTYTGLRAYLESKRPDEQVKTSELQNFIKNNRIQIKEVVLGGSEEYFMERAEEAEKKFGININIDENPMDGSPDINISGDKLDDMTDEEIQDLQNEVNEFVLVAAPESKFHQYQLEGEKEGYKEVLITIPSKVNETRLQELIQKKRDKTITQSEEKEFNELDKKVAEDFQSSHFYEPNIVVHLRMNIREDADGNKVLFLEEVQSDWGQEGKKKGFSVKQDLTELEKEKKDINARIDKSQPEYNKLMNLALHLFGTGYNESNIKHLANLSEAKRKSLVKEKFESYSYSGKESIDNPFRKHVEESRKRSYEAALENSEANLNYDEFSSDMDKWHQITGIQHKKHIAPAPFVTDTNSWVKLGLKVALQHAVKEGANKIAWTTGEQQNDRYNLAKTFDRIVVDGERGSYEVFGYKDGKKILEYGAIKPENLSDYIGKDLADKAIADGGGDYKGLDLKVGGKGMIGFYGSPKEGKTGIIGGVAEKLFGKGSVKTSNINDIGVQNSIDITPEMEMSVDRGLSMFQKNKTDITLEEYRTQKGRDLKQEQSDLEALNDALENETDEDVIAQIENAIANIESNIENDTSDYEDFKKGIVKVKKVADATSLEGFTLDELIEAYHDAKNYDGFADKEMLNQAKMRIGQYLNQAGKDRLRALDKNIDEHANQRDLTKIEVWMKTLGHMSQDFPELQEFYKLFNDAVLKTQTDRISKKSELERLGKEVIKEYNKKMGVKEWAKGLFTSNSAKYFEYLDNGKGQYLTPAEAKSKGLSKAQTDLLNFMRELVKERQAQDADGNIIENEILKTDKGFRENWKDSGLVDAIVQYMGGSNEETEIQHGGKKTTYKDAQKSIITDAKSGLKGKLLAFPKLLQIAYKAKKAGAKTNYGSLNYNGQLTSKFDQPRAKDKGYSKDFYSAAMSYIDDITHVKHMGKLVPLIDSIEQFYKYLGFTEKRAVGNTLKFIEQWKNEQIYQRTGEFDPIIDKALQFFRRLTSMTVMGFNYPAGVINIAIGNYNAWRAEGIGKWAKGQSRFFGGKDRAGLGTVNKKAIDVLNKYGVVSQDFDSNPKMFAGKLFDMLAFGATRFGEYQIQGSMFLGQLSPEEWSAFEYDKNGNLTVNPKKANMTEKAFETKMMQYRDRVSDVQGKYAEKDRRNFMRFEMGKSAGQFKVWIPDWFKERYGKEYIDANNVVHRGSWNMFTEQAIKDLKQDWSKHNIAIAWKNKQMRQNLSGAITIAVLLIATHSDDEDKKKKREALSLENALQNLLFVYDPQQLKYMLESPIASWGTVNKFIDALDATLHGDTKKASKTAKKLIPYNKAITQIEDLTK